MQKFWNMISDNSEMKGILQKVSRSLLNAQKFLFTDSYSSSQTIFLDYLISPNFWKNEYTRIFGKVQYYLEQCGIVFAFSFCEIHTRLPSIHNKGYAYSQNHRLLTTLWQSIACRLIKYTFHFHSDLNFHSR